jgi:hypothetical protein
MCQRTDLFCQLALTSFPLKNAAIAGKFNDWIVCLFRDN